MQGVIVAKKKSETVIVAVKESFSSESLTDGEVQKIDDRELVARVIDVVNSLPGRQKSRDGKPGGLVVFPDGIRPIIIGDLHANRENLALILDHESNRADIESGKAACVFLGDVLHDDRTGNMKNMDSSILILEDVFRLIVRYPGRVYYIRGNHDTYDERLRKSGISQGVEFKNAVTRAKGKDYADMVNAFFECLPLFIIGPNFVITHAGPPHGGVSRDELCNIKEYPEKMHQLMWTRVNEFHGNPSLKEYGEKDIRLTLEILDMPSDSQFIVGHNPLWSDGNRIGFWRDVIGIKHHHILYSGYGSVAPYLTFIDGNMIMKKAAIEKPEVYYYG
jgi:predicted phosphodiesterase